MPVREYIQLREEEVIILIVRRWLPTYVWWYVGIFVLLVGPFFFFFPLMRSGGAGKLAFVASILVGVFLALRTSYVWRRDSIVVTNMRIMDINQSGFSKRTISEASYERVSDVSHVVHGVFRSVFNYGLVKITCGDGSVVLALDNVKNPKEVHNVITEMMERYFTQSQKQRGKRRRAEQLSEHIEELTDQELEILGAKILERLERRQEEAVEEYEDEYEFDDSTEEEEEF